MVQYIRTNSFAVDLADDLARIMKYTSECLVEELCIPQSLSFLLLSSSGKIIGNEEADKILKYAEDPIKKSRIFTFFVRETAVKLSSFNDYTSLKLMQSIISSIRNECSFEPARMIALSLLHKVLLSELALDDHAATIQTLLHSFLFEHKPDIQ